MPLANGGGRPNNSVTRRSLSASERIANSHGLSFDREKAKLFPLDIMLEAMHKVYAQSGAIEAFPLAKECAPYLHPRLNAVDARAQVGITVKVVKFDEAMTLEAEIPPPLGYTQAPSPQLAGD